MKKVSNKQAKKIENPWMTQEILREQRIRDKLRKEWIQSGKIPNPFKTKIPLGAIN